MDIGTAIILSAASLWCVQIVYKDLRKADRRLRNGR
jgi:hypothetical protein